MRPLFLAMSFVPVVGCGTTIDDRPRTTAYVTETVLAGSCAQAQCHSSFRNAKGYALDTIASVKNTLRYEIESNPDGSSLISDQPSAVDQPLDIILRRRNGDQYEGIRGLNAMPLDSPLPEADIVLLTEWAAKGAPGACEIPSGTSVCGFNKNDLVACGPDAEYVFRSANPGACP